VHEQVFYTIHLADVGEFTQCLYFVKTHLHNVSHQLPHLQATDTYQSQTSQARWSL